VPSDIVLVGAHYDSIRGGPGADDNATGTAALLALARGLSRGMQRTVRLVAFANEEHPHTRRRTMGSLVHARACRARRERIIAMLSLECLGFHVRDENARRGDGDLTRLLRLVPVWTDGAFVVSNFRSRRLGEWVASSLQQNGPLPIHRVTAPGFLPLAKSSDHWSFWKNGYPAVMITDAAPLRYRHYHRATDSVERIDAEALAAMTDAVTGTVEALANARAIFKMGVL
jgi:Zn-dependent M28 family amino/carboxypeptidase